MELYRNTYKYLLLSYCCCLRVLKWTTQKWLKYFIFIIIINFLFSDMFVPVLFFLLVNEGLIMPKRSPPLPLFTHKLHNWKLSRRDQRLLFYSCSSVKRKASHSNRERVSDATESSRFSARGRQAVNTHPPSTYRQECFASKRAQLRQLLSTARLRSLFSNL